MQAVGGNTWQLCGINACQKANGLVSESFFWKGANKTNGTGLLETGKSSRQQIKCRDKMQRRGGTNKSQIPKTCYLA